MSGVRVPSAALEDVRVPAYALRPALHGCTSGEVAQLVEHRIENAGVGGSSPPLATSNRRLLRRRFAIVGGDDSPKPRPGSKRGNASQWLHAAPHAWPALAQKQAPKRWSQSDGLKPSPAEWCNTTAVPPAERSAGC